MGRILKGGDSLAEFQFELGIEKDFAFDLNAKTRLELQKFSKIAVISVPLGKHTLLYQFILEIKFFPIQRAK